MIVTWINRDGTNGAVKVLCARDNEVVDLTWRVAQILNLRFGHGGVEIGGAQMSRETQLAYMLWQVMGWPGGPNYRALPSAV